ncbi:MAG: hypothetical protein F6J93_16530 [Oscillatoria sp. SIO1A7]|nr:hypothetical protein [Oscillatoria sp. SIO1A7]
MTFNLRDAYMIVGGLPVPRSDRAEAIAYIAYIAIYRHRDAVYRFQAEMGERFQIRIGIIAVSY